MKILKAIGNYFLNILTVLAIAFFALITAIFAPKHLGQMIMDTGEEIHKAKKTTKKKK